MKRRFILAFYLLSIMILSSCSLQGSNHPLNIQSKNGLEHNSKLKHEKKGPEKNLTFAIIYPVAHPFFESVTVSAKETAEQLGVDVIIQAPDASNINHQIQILENMIKREVDGIAIGPTDPTALTPFINKAIDAGIDVICFDTDAPESKRLSFIGTDNLAAGHHLGEVVARELNYQGNIVISTGISSMQNLSARIDGVKQTLEKYPNIEILAQKSSDGIPAKTLMNIEELIEKYPHFDALVGIDSLSGPAAITAWKAKGLSKKLITFDDLDIILDGISNKQVTSTISQSQYTWGKLIIEKLFDANKSTQIDQTIYTETIEINEDNIENYKQKLNMYN
ncbi:sugar ABC transporter substrate-binding protein [Metabacillus malikii]|uniref:Ribose transport system substrate-binding protein n=1 Tax=Metabacillus malikii TaxID=1504265 RepID=A0ABT9ZFX6_9BACI|nr:substrate-binding domain-containing protein [Metabacillus malikii]MDQ0231191.1 ribose transport system substrate-binding protein [Metabacillus malikii]